MSILRGLDASFAYLRERGRPIPQPVRFPVHQFKRLVAELYLRTSTVPDVTVIEDGYELIVYDGIGIRSRPSEMVEANNPATCTHAVVSKFTDATYCHDCKTLCGDGHTETHRRSSNIGTN